MKKLVGSLFLLVALSIYALICVIIGASFIPHVWYVELPYYIVAGIAWAFPTKYLIVWMNREPSD